MQLTASELNRETLEKQSLQNSKGSAGLLEENFKLKKQMGNLETHPGDVFFFSQIFLLLLVQLI